MMWGATKQARPRMDAARFLFGAMGATDAERQPLASDAELAQPAAALLLSQVLGPALRSLLPSDALVPSDTAAANAARGPDNVADLVRTVAELRDMVTKQQSEINELKGHR